VIMYSEREDLSPLGYYNVGQSYLDAAELVRERRLPFEGPARAMYAHAWELTLKACLRVQGQSVSHIHNVIRHDLVKAYDAIDLDRFSDLKLIVARFLVEQLNDFHLERINFYPKAGSFNVLNLDDVGDWSRRLRLERNIASKLFFPG